VHDFLDSLCRFISPRPAISPPYPSPHAIRGLLKHTAAGLHSIVDAGIATRIFGHANNPRTGSGSVRQTPIGNRRRLLLLFCNRLGKRTFSHVHPPPMIINPHRDRTPTLDLVTIKWDEKRTYSASARGSLACVGRYDCRRREEMCRAGRPDRSPAVGSSRIKESRAGEPTATPRAPT